MTDKQIIDGVDVIGCERHCSGNRNNPNMCYNEMTRTYSRCNPKEKQCNFYITSIEKQLKRKEQECEFSNLRVIQLQETLSQYETDLSTKDCIVETCKAQYKELEAENERLKHDNEYEVGALEKTIDNLKAELEQEKALKETYLACYKTKHEDIEGELFKLRQYKKSKQASYETLQKRCNELELENRTLAREILKLNSAVDFITLTEHSAINKYNKFKQTLTEINDIVKNMNEECFYGDFKCEDCDFKNGCTYQAKKQLKQKISEVLGDNL